MVISMTIANDGANLIHTLLSLSLLSDDFANLLIKVIAFGFCFRSGTVFYDDVCDLFGVVVDKLIDKLRPRRR